MKDLKILILEDNDFQRMLIRDMIISVGVDLKNIEEATDGEEALRKAEEIEDVFDIVFLDLRVPKIDGIEVLDIISRREKANAFVLLSSLDKSILDSIKLSLRSSSINLLGVLPKPLRLPVVSEIMREYLGRQRKVSKGESVAEYDSRIYSVDNIEKGILNDEFFPYFQPQVELKSKKIKGIESLARWGNPKNGIILPVKFIPTVESNRSLNRKFTLMMFEKSLDALREFRKVIPDIKMSINISVNLIEKNLVKEFSDLVNRYCLDTEEIIIEITESGFASNENEFLSVLSRLRIAGFGISMDDFGTGFSSMSQLIKIPLTELKIDKEFISGLSLDSKKRAITQATVNLARDLGIELVAEGVEREEDMMYLDKYDFIVIQGYYFCKPLPFSECLVYLKSHT